MTMAKGYDVFIGYSRTEKPQLEQLTKHLFTLIDKDAITTWDDSGIEEAKLWRNDLEAALHKSKLAVFLVSAAFLTSKYVPVDDVPAWLLRARARHIPLCWIALTPCDSTHLLSEYPALNDPTHPLDQFTGAALDDELLKICRQIALRIESPTPDSGAIAPVVDASAPPQVEMTEPLPMLTEEERMEMLGDLGFLEVAQEEDPAEPVEIEQATLREDYALSQEGRFEGYLRYLMHNERFMVFFKELVKITDPKKVKVLGDKLGITPEWTAPTGTSISLKAADTPGTPKTDFQDSLQRFDSTCRLALQIGHRPDPLRLTFDTKTSFVIGQSRGDSSQDVDLAAYLDKPYGVSRRHVRIWKENDRLYIQDLKSRNRTYVNGQCLHPEQQPYMLSAGDKIRMGTLLVIARYEKIPSEN